MSSSFELPQIGYDKPMIEVKRLDKDLPLPKYETQGAVGMDLCADENAMLSRGTVRIVPTGIAVAIPEGWEIQIRPRSGLAAKAGVTVVNAPGTIDQDYRGEIKVILTKISNGVVDIKKGDRIAQMVVCPVGIASLVEVDELSDTERGEDGFGSTGS